MNFQRGSASLGIALAISISMSVVIFLYSLSQNFGYWMDAEGIRTTIQKITYAAENSYKEKVIGNACITDSSTMSISRLITEKRIPSDINSGLYSYGVTFTTVKVNTWSRPNYINVTVKAFDSASYEGIAGNLKPTRYDATSYTLTFSIPINIDLSDSWSQFDKQTGCLQ